MAKYVFKKDNAGIRRMLQDKQCLDVMKKHAMGFTNSDKIRPFIGFDRAKVFVREKK